MTPLQQLQLILDETYTSEDGDEYTIKLRPALSDQQIDGLAEQLPGRQVPPDVRELLRFSRGFEFSWLEEVSFDGVGDFGFEEIFPYSVQLAGDGLGNFWIVDVSGDGAWGAVYFVCHDPAVVVKQSDNLGEFIKHIDEYGKKGSASNLGIIHGHTVWEIWKKDNGFADVEEARADSDEVLSAFAMELPDHYVVADLRDKPNGSGFAWGKFGPDIDNAVRHTSELIWGFEKNGRQSKPAKPNVAAPASEKKGFWRKLFGR